MRVKIFCGALLLLMLNVVVLYAQPGTPCDGTDPDLPCPLDTWVIVFAIAATAFAAIRLYRKQLRLNGNKVINTSK
ncbi:MAG TPA: hypothetical protein DCO83_12305 [Mucilaginibacter sp.]|jgi:hypothetical protein|nr:hypothetical protein [Mucilaginibacter sp.]